MRLVALWLGLLSLILQVPAHAAGKELVVGVLPYQPARQLIADHQALATHLRAALERPVRIVTASNVRAFTQRMLAGDYELAVAPAHLVRLAQLEQGWQPLARYVPDTAVLLLARKADADTTVATLKGGVLATPDRIRLVSLVAEHWLAHQQLVAGRDYQVLETAGFGSAVHALLSGQADMAISTQSGMGQVRSADREQVRVVSEIATIPVLVFAARADLKPDTQARLGRALLAYRTPQGVRTAPVAPQDLAAMDQYLDPTRRLLKLRAPPTRQAGR